METFDTNVVLRIVYRDDPEQAARAGRAWQKAVDSGGIADGKWQPHGEPARSIEDLARERTSPGVQSALKSPIDAPSSTTGSRRKR